MNLIDKLLLLLLVLMLPLGLVVSYSLHGSQEDQKEDELLALQQQKIDQVISQLNHERENQKATKPKPFTIASIEYASESASLKVAGKAPGQGASVLVSATVLPASEEDVEEKDIIQGLTVETVSVIPRSDQGFIFELPVKAKKGVVEFRFQQNETVTTIHYDLETKKQVQ